MKSVETKLGADGATAFRNELLSGIAAWAIDHPEEDVDYEALFPRYIEQLRQAYFDDRRGQVGEIGRAIVGVLEEDDTLGDRHGPRRPGDDRQAFDQLRAPDLHLVLEVVGDRVFAPFQERTRLGRVQPRHGGPGTDGI